MPTRGNFRGKSPLSYLMPLHSRARLLTLVLLACGVAAVGSAMAQEGWVIRSISVEGAEAMTPESVLFYTEMKEGQVVDDEILRREYQNLWRSGLFRSLSIETAPFEDGIEIIIAVKEKPILRRIDYKGAKRVTETRVKEIFSQNNVSLDLNEPLSFSQVRRAESLLKALLESRGYKDAVITTTVEDLGRNEVALVFRMAQGARVKIKKIEFEGNEAYSDFRLKRRMKKVKEAGLWNSLRRKHIFSEQKLYEELQNVVNFYQDRGYVPMTLDEPRVHIRDLTPPSRAAKMAAAPDRESLKKESKKKKKSEEDISKDKRKLRAFIVVPVQEGVPYVVGNVSFRGHTVFTDEELRAKVTFREGDLYKHSEVQKTRKAVDAMYGEKGYIFSQTGLVPKTNPDTRVVDLTFDILEGKPYHLRFLDFRGNTTTRDSVLRREFLVHEGELFNSRMFDRSLRKVAQLGYFKITQAPNISPVDNIEGKDKNEVDVVVVGQEDNKNTFEFGGGYSGLEGGFLQTSFQTRNFMGRGEQFEVMARLGGRMDRYSISFVEPWLFDRPYTLGFSLYRVRREYLQFNQTSQGGSVTFGVPVTYFSRFFLRYSYETTQLDARSGFSDQLGLISLNKTRIVQITPWYQYDSRNHHYTPSDGFFFTVMVPVAHWSFGSDVSYYKFYMKATRYFPTWKRTYFAANGEFGWVRPFEGHRVPASERFFLGGSSSIRGYGTRSVGPVFEGLVYGGDTYITVNAEYTIPVGQAFQFVFFGDAGQAYALDPIRTVYQGNIVTLETDFDFEFQTSVGFEVRFFVPMFPYPIRLIWSKPINPEPWQPTKTFEFNIGPTF